MSNQTDRNPNESDEERAARETKDIDARCEEAYRLAHVRLGIEFVCRVTGVHPHEVTPDLMEWIAQDTKVLSSTDDALGVFFYDGIPIMAATLTPTVTVERIGNEPASVSGSFLILDDEGMKRTILRAMLDEGEIMTGGRYTWRPDHDQSP